jgi:hypothetical protein
MPSILKRMQLSITNKSNDLNKFIKKSGRFMMLNKYMLIIEYIFIINLISDINIDIFI